ncbi:hypothetical protein GCM10008961_29200 [Deinococcus knuensis]|uniref:Secreted protein n=1 Tax=Deinococcus knuensis TaxID=1837380 RepID=A0ABQ2SP58_9DEIO|nr:hypothetical protein GCM10008961_29200 [Deinococcus knuensis]
MCGAVYSLPACSLVASLAALRVALGGLRAVREQDGQRGEGDHDGGQSEDEFHDVSVPPGEWELMTAVLKWRRAALQGAYNCP